MSDTRNTYEGMFLFPQSAASGLKEAADHVQALLDRAGAEVISFAKWDERRLAYEIAGNKRGVYFLAYFNAEPSAMAGLERTCNLSEEIMRFMFVRAETIPSEIIEAADGRDKLADEIKLRSEKDEKGRPGTRDGRSRVVDAATRAEEERQAAEGKKSGDAAEGSEGTEDASDEAKAEDSSDAEKKSPAPAEAGATE